MNDDVKRDLHRSRIWFDRFTRRALERQGYRKIFSLETLGTNVSDFFDFNGIDAVAEKDGDLCTIASRSIGVTGNATDDKNRCFSLRNKRVSGGETELSKLQRKIKLNLPRPFLHCQCFVNGDLATVGIIRTADLVGFASEHENDLPTIETKDKTTFVIVPWRTLIENDVDVRIQTIENKKNTAPSAAG